MKILLLLLVLTTTAYADEFNWTGRTAEKIDPIGWAIGGTGPIGGPWANERMGLAQQFEIFQPTHMTYLNVHALVVPNGASTITFNYNLYEDSDVFTLGEHNPLLRLPSPESILTSESISYKSTQEDDNSGKSKEYDNQVAFDYIFNPGIYWLSEEGRGASYAYLSTTFVDPPIQSNTATVPEPSTWLLFTIIIGFVLIRNRQIAWRI